MFHDAAEELDSMFPPKKDPGQKGAARNKNFRCPAALQERIDLARAGGYSESDVIRQTLEIGFDCKDAMGTEWWEIVKESRAKEESIGATLGRLAADGLRARRKMR